MAKQLAYYTACVDRSQDRLLTVSITSENMQESFGSHGPAADWQNTAYCEKFCHHLKGKNDTIIRRFEALHIDLSGWYREDRHLASLFTARAPNLYSLSFKGSYGDMVWKDFVNNAPLKILSSLHNRLLTLGANSFKGLKVLECFDDQNLPWISSIPTLESLTLRRVLNSRPNLVKPIALPRLRKLTLIGEWHTEIVEKMELPSLVCLKFVTDQEFTLYHTFKAKPQELHWETSDRYKLPHIGFDFEASIGSTLARHKYIKVIKVPGPAKDLILDVLKNVIQKGAVSMDIVSVRVLDDSSVVFNLDIHSVR
jgi:hypothetical protein